MGLLTQGQRYLEMVDAGLWLLVMAVGRHGRIYTDTKRDPANRTKLGEKTKEGSMERCYGDKSSERQANGSLSREEVERYQGNNLEK